MLQNEADQLITLINSFVGEEVIVVTKAEEAAEPREELTEEETKKLFRNQVPEEFSFDIADLVRSGGTGDKVWLRFGMTKRHIPDLETLEKMGYNLGDVHDISSEDIKQLKEESSLYPARLW